MALFGRAEDKEALLKRIEAKGYATVEEKRDLLRRLAGEEVRQEVLLRFLLAEDADLARFAVEAFGRSRDPRAVDPLLTALSGLPRSRWRPCIQALHALEAPLVLERVAQLLGGKRAEVRALALEVLAAHPKAHEQIHILKVGLRDPDERLRVRAVQILQGGLGEAIVRYLLREQLSNPDDAVRHAAILLLAQDPDPDLIEVFFDLLPSEPARVQETMIRGLGRMLRGGGAVADRVLERMLPLLAADDERIREAAAKLLAATPDKLALLRRFLQYAKGLAFWLRDRSFSAIAKVSDDLTDAVRTLLADEDVDVVVGASVLAQKSGEPGLLEALEQVLRRDLDWWVKVPVLETVATFKDDRVRRILLRALDDEELSTAALASLGLRAEPSTMEEVMRFLGDERRGLRRAALQALRAYKDPVLIAALERIARGDSDGDCRMLALEILEDYGAQGVATAESIRLSWLGHPSSPGAPSSSLTMVNPDLNPRQ